MSSQRVINLSLLVCSTLIGAFFAVAYLTLPADTTSAAPTQPVAITQLTHDPGNALHPAWSPDNRLIAFESNRDGPFHIYVMNADGSGARALTRGENDTRRPVWTPDGKSILYDLFDGVHQDIWSVNPADGSRKQLTRVDGLADFATLSPDGQQLVFYLYKDMTLNLWTARADGSNATQLTSDLADARRLQPTMSWHQAAWSLDSQWLAYTGGNGISIWIMRRDGSEARSIIDDGETNHFPRFLADGRLAYVTEYVPPKYGAAWTNLWTCELKSGQRTPVYQFMSMQEPVAWNSDLSKLAFASPRNGHFDIYLIDVNAPGGLEALRGELGMQLMIEGH